MNVHLNPPETVVPGETGTASIVIENDSDVVRSYRLSAVGVDGWAQVTPGVIKLFPGETTEAHVIFHPPLAPTVAAGVHPFAVRCVATDDATEVRVEESTVTVAPYENVDLRLRPSCGRARRTARFRLVVVNSGNHRQRLGVEATDDDDMLAFDITPAAVTLDAGAAATIRVRARQESARPGETLPFTIVVGSARSAAGSTNGSLRVRRGVLGKLLAVVAAVLAIAMVALALSRDETPSEAKDLALPSTTLVSTVAPAPTDPSTTAIATSTTVVEGTTTTTAGVPAATTTTPPVAVATTTTSTSQPPVVDGQPEILVSTTLPATTTTTITLIPMTVVTVFFPPVLIPMTTTTTTRPLQPVLEYSTQDILVTFLVYPHEWYDFTANCQLIHSSSEVSAYTSTILPSWSIDVTKGDWAHPGLSDISDSSNPQAQATLTDYNFQRSSDNTFAVTGTVCGAANNGATAIFQHTYRVYMVRTLWL